jgi:hypothetical protein
MLSNILVVCKNKLMEFILRIFCIKLGPETFPDLTYIVQMRRRPLFYVFNMILPCFLITTVAFLGFCVPSDSGIIQLFHFSYSLYLF